MVLSMLYLPYMLMLRRESFFRFNRMILLGILFLSLVLPLCNISAMSLDHQPVVQAAQLQILEFGIPIHVLPELQVIADGTVKYGTTGFSVFLLISVLYIIGMMMLLAMRLWQVGRLQLGLRKGTLWQQEEQGVRICCHAEDVIPFSWMRNIVISQKDYEEAGHEIVLHEMGHIQAHHSWDVILLTLVQMLQWWNPLAYVLGISLRDVHEYEADDYVLRQGISAQTYQLLLIKKAVGSGSYAFANSFNHSLTKKRITMMKNSNSNPWMRSKALYVIPVAALALSAFATPKFVAPIEGAVTKLEGKGTENTPNLQVFEKENLEEAQPLIVLNGKIFEIPKDAKKDIIEEEQFSKLLNINIEDIKSITVLQKDSAIAKWGDKGANGVILITTKDKDVIIKDLVKKLPGAEMDEDGTIKIRGRKVSKIKIDDKEVFNKTDSI
jgi:TonB-dependent SusC/RagA subfamily outer membrane receptor